MQKKQTPPASAEVSCLLFALSWLKKYLETEAVLFPTPRMSYASLVHPEQCHKKYQFRVSWAEAFCPLAVAVRLPFSHGYATRNPKS